MRKTYKDMRLDCFARPRLDREKGRISCQALNDAGTNDCRTCWRYRSKRENDRLLLDYNGTTDLDKIVNRYQYQKRKRRLEENQSFSARILAAAGRPGLVPEEDREP